MGKGERDASDAPRSAFRRSPKKDTPDRRQVYLDPNRGCHAFFRHVNQRMQRRFTELTDPSQIPTVLLHGNPHLANYAKNSRGAAMVDFDRSRLGPCAYDLVRFTVSMALRQAHRPSNAPLPGTVLQSLRRGYLFGAQCPEADYEEMEELRRRRRKPWQRSVAKLLKSGKGWGRKFTSHQVDPTQPRYAELLESYFSHRGEGRLLEETVVRAAADVPGSFGKMHHVVLLAPKKSKDDTDWLLLDFKETYDEPDTEWYKNPFAHNGERMLEAGRVYAPGWEIRPGLG